MVRMFSYYYHILNMSIRLTFSDIRLEIYRDLGDGWKQTDTSLPIALHT